MQDKVDTKWLMEQTGYTRTSICRFAQDGVIIGEKCGGAWIFDIDDAMAFVVMHKMKKIEMKDEDNEKG